MTLAEAEMRLKVPLDFRVTPIKQMLEGKSGLLGPDAILKVKGQVYENLVGFLEVVGYPTDVNLNFNEVNINDMVGRTIYPVLVQFKRETMRELYLTRERLITSKDSRTSGIEEFAVMDYISLSERKYILVVEAKKVSDVDAGKHCFLVLKDMRDFNGGGTVYGFVTMGDYWKMITYDGEFKISEPIGLLFETMGQNEKQWMANYSILVDCFNVALSHGEKDRVEIV
ncbi:hypothetical protein HOY82DRAFT_651127 [Tuber indicum]|nr:hypothetical protein HOY82DRAFT_651127 [Tuber indicum]